MIDNTLRKALAENANFAAKSGLPLYCTALVVSNTMGVQYLNRVSFALFHSQRLESDTVYPWSIQA